MKKYIACTLLLLGLILIQSAWLYAQPGKQPHSLGRYVLSLEGEPPLLKQNDTLLYTVTKLGDTAIIKKRADSLSVITGKKYFLLFRQKAGAEKTAINVRTKREITPRDSVVQFIPTTIGPFCPRELLGGDREFDGHGPEIWASIKLSINEQYQIKAEVFMHAREIVSDWSETQGTWHKVIYTAPRGWEIVEIISGKFSEVHYISKPGLNAFSPNGLVRALGGARGTDVPFRDDGLVTRWNIVGDTGGGDISTDDNCHDDTQVAIQLNPVRVKLRYTGKIYGPADLKEEKNRERARF